MLKNSIMTNAVNAISGLDRVGWGRTGAAAGAAMGGAVGMFSDDTSMMGGAFKGAIMGGLGGKGLRFGSKFLRDEAGMATYQSTSMMNKFFPDGVTPVAKDWLNRADSGISAAVAAGKQLKATAVGTA